MPNPIYIYIYRIWHKINYNTIYIYIYIYIQYHIYIYIYTIPYIYIYIYTIPYIYIQYHIYIYIYIYNLWGSSLLVTFLNKPGFICLHTVKWLQVLLYVVWQQLNGFNYCYLPKSAQMPLQISRNRWLFPVHLRVCVLRKQKQYPSSCTRTFLNFLADLTNIKQVYFRSSSWDKSVKASDKNMERKIENSVRARTRPCFTPFPTSYDSKSSPLKLILSFLFARQILAWRTGLGTLVSVGIWTEN